MQLDQSVTDQAHFLATEISSQYALRTQIVDADVFLMDLVGRQNMLIHKIAKETCLIVADLNADAARAALAETTQVFDASLSALQNGMPTMGVRRPPTPQIAAQMDALVAEWTAVRTRLQDIAAGAPADVQMAEANYNDLQTLAIMMGDAITMYIEAING
ncbi:MAG: type IV pili methyl-accepting chemotaxis transducer N-terminal domain-containing protein [Pseudomonadota bacterium]